MRCATPFFAYVLLFLSGAAALGYQMAWTRMFAPGLGHETPAMLAVVGAFMAGNALGAAVLDRRIARTANPLRWYAALELVIGTWAFVSVLLIPFANRTALRLVGISPLPLFHWFVAFVGPALALLPATTAMGATFPAMERFVAALKKEGRSVAAVYAANTLGAVVGVLVATFVVAPSLGFSSTVMSMGMVNLFCGGVALLLSTQKIVDGDRSMSGTSASGSPQLSLARMLVALFVTGLLGIGFEVAGTRVLAQILENTVFTYAAVLAVYLLGTAAGAAVYQRLGHRADSRATMATLAAATAVACMAGLLALGHAQSIHEWARRGDSVAAVLAADAVVAAAVFGPATLAMGALFSHLVQAVAHLSGRVGSAVALNTLGGALSAPLFGVALLPFLGSKWTLAGGAFAYLLIAPTVARTSMMFGIGAALLLIFLPQNFHFVTVPPGGRVVAFREGVMAAVAVIEDAQGARTLRVNNRFQMGGTAAADAEYRGAHIPLLLHPAPRRALFLGLGTGITVGGAMLHPNLEIDGVELVPEVVELMPLFEPQNRAPQSVTNVHIYVADAGRFAGATTNRYDVIVADLFHPARDGAGALYTVEHFTALRHRLAPGGLVCQWLPLHQLDGDMLEVIIRTFSSVFPQTEAFLLRFNVDVPVVGLVGRTEPPRYSTNRVESRLDAPDLRDELKRLALADTLRLLGHYVTAKPVNGERGINSDDDPLITFGAPRFVYNRSSLPFDRLLSLIQAAPAGTPFKIDPQFDERLRTYIQARDIYLKGLVADYENHADEALRLYLESARLSPEFTSGYAQALTIASLSAKSDPTRARAILTALIDAQPARPVARQMLERLGE